MKLELSASVGFIHKESITMHTNIILKNVNKFTTYKKHEYKDLHVTNLNK